MTTSEGGNGRGVTLDAVARVAGVSRATVSRVVNGNPKVGDEAKRQVERAIERLGYVPNPAARSLVTRRSESVGVVIPEPTGLLFEDPFFPRLLRGISAELSVRNLQLVLLMPQSLEEERRVETYLAAGHVDGALLTSLHGDDKLPVALSGRGIPVVVGGRPPGSNSVSYVDVDNVGGARTAVLHLIDRGCRTIATIGGPPDMSVGIDRVAGYRRALADRGRPHDASLEVTSDFTQEGGAIAMRRILDVRPDVDGIFAASDLLAAGALQVLRTAGRVVPDDVAVVGFDDSSIATASEPTLTSVRQPSEEMGREMVRLLVEAMSSSRPIAKRVLLGTELVVRESSGRVARG